MTEYCLIAANDNEKREAESGKNEEVLDWNIQCDILGKRVKPEAADYCDYICPMPWGEPNAISAEKLLSLDYRPTCNECRYNSKNDFMNYSMLPPPEALPSAGVALVYINNLVEGDRAENLEEAIRICELALKECSPTESPVDWSEAKHALGFAYYHRLRGNRRENMEHAVAAFQAGLEVWNREEMPAKWAGIATSLASAYVKRGKGDRVENVEEAITLLTEALAALPHGSSRRTSRGPGR